VIEESEGVWTAAELKAMRSELSKDLARLKAELIEAEGEMEESQLSLLASEPVMIRADAGTKTFEREHEMSLVYNARDMALQTERAIERIDTKSYGAIRGVRQSNWKGSPPSIPSGNALPCVCKQKEERR
jgi:RNA polymerase-binding transcription factor DksA